MAPRGPDVYHRYLPISPLDRRWGLHVRCGGYLRVPPGTPYPLPGHPRRYALEWQDGRVLDEFQVHYITRGSGRFEASPGRHHAVAAGSAFLLFPGAWHRYAPDPGSGWDEFWVGFQGPHAHTLMAPPFFSPRVPVIAVEDGDALLEQFTALVAAMRADRPHMQRLLAGYTYLMLAVLQAQAANDALDAQATQAIQRTKRAIAAALTHPIDGEALARQAGVGYHWLRRAFRRSTGFTLHGYHTQLRVNAAMHALEGSDRTIAAIAQELGFSDSYYFSRVFRRQVGQAPAPWRRMRRGGR